MPNPALLDRLRAFRLLTTRGVVRVRVCGLCAALVLAEGLEHHERVHIRALGGEDAR